MLNLPIKILDRIVVDVETAQVTFENINMLVARWDALAKVTSRHLVLIINARSIEASDYITNFLRFNGSLATDYSMQRLSGADDADSAGRMEGANAINLPPIAGANNVNTFGGSMVLIPHAFNTVNHKALLALGGASEFIVEVVAARWAQAAAITSVTILEGVGDDYVVGSEFLLGVIDERYLVEEIEDAAADFSPTFDNIPQGEGDLVVIGYPRTDRANHVDDIRHTINDDAVAGNYLRQYIEGVGAVTGADSAASRIIGSCAGGTATANVFGSLVAIYSQYAKNNQPHYLASTGIHESGIPWARVIVVSGRRANIEPINKLHLEPDGGTDFKAGSLFSLYRVPKRVIERVVVPAGGQATITFDNIPDYYEALILHVYARSDEDALLEQIIISFNGDLANANYGRQFLWGIGAGVLADRGDTRIWLYCSGDTATVGEFSGGTLFFPAYARTDRHKHIVQLLGVNERRLPIMSNRWKSNAALSQIELITNLGTVFLAGSVFELEGVLRKEGLPADAGMRWG